MVSKIVRLLGGSLWIGFSLKLFGVEFLTFPFYDEAGNAIYANEDVRLQSGILPFPCIFHYNNGGETSTYSDFRIINKPQEEVLASMPEKLSVFLAGQNIEQSQFFEAYCRLLQKDINYFTHAWAMDRMVENRTVSIASGMFAPVNLCPVAGEVGVDTVVSQVMSFHDKVYLSGNSARFMVKDSSHPAEAWFVSIYDPKSNAGKNAECNQIKRAIVVHWYFLPESQWKTLADVEPYSEVIKSWISGDVIEMLSLFTPQK